MKQVGRGRIVGMEEEKEGVRKVGTQRREQHWREGERNVNICAFV